jgi:hypothetical protein
MPGNFMSRTPGKMPVRRVRFEFVGRKLVVLANSRKKTGTRFGQQK